MKKMYIRKMKHRDFELLEKQLIEYADSLPLDTCYTVNLTVNNQKYMVRIQPEFHNQMVVLQAWKVESNGECQDFILITRTALLAAFLEILIEQGLYR